MIGRKPCIAHCTLSVQTTGLVDYRPADGRMAGQYRHTEHVNMLTQNTGPVNTGTQNMLTQNTGPVNTVTQNMLTC